jgi:hypothetical protein
MGIVLLSVLLSAGNPNCTDTEDVISFFQASNQTETIGRKLPALLDGHNRISEIKHSLEIWPGKFIQVKSIYRNGVGELLARKVSYCGFLFNANDIGVENGYMNYTLWWFPYGGDNRMRYSSRGFPLDFTETFSLSPYSGQGVDWMRDSTFEHFWKKSSSMRVTTRKNLITPKPCEGVDSVLRFLLSAEQLKDPRLPISPQRKNNHGKEYIELFPGAKLTVLYGYNQKEKAESVDIYYCKNKVRSYAFSEHWVKLSAIKWLPGGLVTKMHYTEFGMPREYSRYKLINGKEVRDGLYLRWVPDKDILETQSFYVNGEERIPPYLY